MLIKNLKIERSFIVYELKLTVEQWGLDDNKEGSFIVRDNLNETIQYMSNRKFTRKEIKETVINILKKESQYVLDMYKTENYLVHVLNEIYNSNAI